MRHNAHLISSSICLSLREVVPPLTLLSTVAHSGTVTATDTPGIINVQEINIFYDTELKTVSSFTGFTKTSKGDKHANVAKGYPDVISKQTALHT